MFLINLKNILFVLIETTGNPHDIFYFGILCENEDTDMYIMHNI